MENISEINKYTKEYKTLTLFTVVAVIIEGYLTVQGVSMYDETWVMSAYYWIFRDPEACQYQMLYYNTLLIGGLWEKLFGQYGYLAFRIGGAIINILSCYAIYWVLKPHVKQRILILTLYLFLISFGYGVVVIHHNWITALTTVLAVGFIDRALRNRNYLYFFIAGSILGINIFTRLPNIALCGMVTVLIPYSLFTYRRTRDKTFTIHHIFRILIVGVMGYMVGLFFELFLLSVLGHRELFFENLSVSFNIAGSIDNSHSALHMLHSYISNYWGIFKCICMLPILPVLWWCGQLIYVIYAFFTVTLLYALYSKRNKERKFYIFFMALLIAYLQPLGSDNGVCNMGDNSDYLAIALTISVICESCSSLLKRKEYWIPGFFIISLLSYCVKMTYSIAHTCDFDDGLRWDKTFKINSPLATTYTTEEKATTINTLLEAIKPYVKKGDYLIAFDNPPGINYLTETRPWLGTSWLLCYDYATLEKELCKNEKRKSLPIIVTSKGTPTDFMAYFKDWDNENTSEKVYYLVPQKIKLRHEFIKKHNYIVAWQNKHFIIYIPLKSGIHQKTI